MTSSDAPEFLSQLMALSELFNAKLSAAAQTLYFDALIDLDLESIRVAMTEAARTCKFMPKPAEVRDLILGPADMWAEKEWEELKGLARRLGQYDGSWVEFISDEGTDALRAVFGSWAEFCTAELSPEMWSSKRKEFMRSYARREQRSQRQSLYKRLRERDAQKLIDNT